MRRRASWNVLRVLSTVIIFWGPALLVAEARERGEVVVYSARIEKLIKPMFEAFTHTTGIEVKYFTASEAELFERLKAEGIH
ncbi:MAG: Fe(3+) ABC transporter substrate-binding protein, partial [Candidatus Methylomirabilales bacterium]